MTVAATSKCVLPPDFVDTDPPATRPVEELFSHAEEILVNRPVQVVYDAIAELELEDQTYRGMALPKIVGTFMLPTGAMEIDGSPGLPSTRTVAFFSDGGTVVEQPTEVGWTDGDFRYLYVVWNYTSPAFRPIRYGIGDITYTAVGEGQCRIRWKYSFELDVERYPDYAGAAGERKFRDEFLEGPFAELLRGSLAIWKVRAESYR